MGKKQFVINFLILVFLFGVVYILTQNAKPIREIFEKPQELIAGANISAPDGKEKLPQELAEDASEKLETVKDNAMQITFGQVVDFVGKGGKVIEDIKNLQSTINQFLASQDNEKD